MFLFDLFDLDLEIVHVFNREVGIGLCLLGIAAVTWIIWYVCKVMSD